MKQLGDLIDNRRNKVKSEKSILIETYDLSAGRPARVNILALGDVGGMVLTGLRLMGNGAISSIGIYDLNEKLLDRYEREINQIRFPDGRSLPRVSIISEKELFDCDMFVFCASKGVPPVGTSGDVRMAQLKANSELITYYADAALNRGFRGIFAIVSDPVDPLCKAAVLRGIDPAQVQGYGLGVMNARAAYFAEKDERFAMYLSDGRAFGPHGEDLVIANSISNYSEALSLKLTELTVNSNMETRAVGFKPYIAPALSSGAISLIETLKGGWNYSSVYFGAEAEGAFFGCRNKRTAGGIEIEDIPLCDALYERIRRSYDNLCELSL